MQFALIVMITTVIDATNIHHSVHNVQMDITTIIMELVSVVLKILNNVKNANLMHKHKPQYVLNVKKDILQTNLDNAYHVIQILFIFHAFNVNLILIIRVYAQNAKINLIWIIVLVLIVLFHNLVVLLVHSQELVTYAIVRSHKLIKIDNVLFAILLMDGL